MMVYFACLAVWLAELLRIPDPNDHVDDSSLFWLSVCLHWGATFLACTTGVLIGADMELQRSTLRKQLRSSDASKAELADCSSETDRAEILAAIDGIYEGVGGIDAFWQGLHFARCRGPNLDMGQVWCLPGGHTA